MTSKAKTLGKRLGGKWKYGYPCYWHCDDGIRYIARCSAGVDEQDNEVGTPQYWLYGDGTPRRAEKYFQTELNMSIYELFEIANQVGYHPQFHMTNTSNPIDFPGTFIPRPQAIPPPRDGGSDGKVQSSRKTAPNSSSKEQA